MKYVTYDPVTGALTGSYLQDLLPEHEAHHIVIDDATSLNWPAYQANAARDGVELAPVVPPPPVVPMQVTRRQGLQQLRLEGFTEADIEALIALLPVSALQKDLALIEFRTSQVFERNRPLTLTLGAMIGKDSAALDATFIAANAL